MGRKNFLKVKYAALGMIAAALLGQAAQPALAALTGTPITAYTGVRVYVNDTPLDAGETHGNPDAFIYNGTTYVAVSAVSKSLGYPVQWDGATKSVYIGDHENRAGVFLGEMDTFYESSLDVVKFWDRTDNLGLLRQNTYGLHSSISSAAWAVYALNGQYDTLSGIYFLTQEHKSTKEIEILNIYGDDELLYTISITAGTEPIQFEVDISNVLSLKVEMKTTASRNGFPVALGAVDQLKLY